MKTNPVCGWTNPSESISQIRLFPQVGMNIKKCLKPLPSRFMNLSCVWMLKHFFGGRIPDSRWGHWLSHKPKLRINQLVLYIYGCFCRWWYPKMDDLQWKTLLKWMIWGCHYFRKHPYAPVICVVLCVFTTHPGKLTSKSLLFFCHREKSWNNTKPTNYWGFHCE